MQVADILKRKGHRVYTIAPERTLWDAAALLAERNIGAVVVVAADGRMQGIFTERDLAREVCRQPEKLRTARVAESMSREVATCKPEDDLRAVQLLMDERKIRHLPVFDGDRLAGLISIRDVLGALYRETVDDANELRDHLARHYVVC